MKLDTEHWIAKLPDLLWDAVSTCCFATLKMSYRFNCFFESRKFIKLLFEWMLRNVMDDSVLRIAVSKLWECSNHLARMEVLSERRFCPSLLLREVWT